MTISDLNKIREIKIDEINEMQKPKIPHYFSSTKNYWIMLAINIPAIAFSVYGTTAWWAQDNKWMYIFLIVVLSIASIVAVYGVTINWHNTLKEHKRIIKHWKKHKQNLICQTEAKFDDYAHQLITTGTIRTDDPYIKQALGLVPKCPTCGSTDIVSVSGIRRDLAQTAFGIANPTARAQFKCNNCGYKW